jgi:PAS domain S-box-containing protein
MSTALALAATAPSILVAALAVRHAWRARAARSTAESERARAVEEAARVREELRVHQSRFELAVERSTDGVWDWNVATGAFWYSRRLVALLGASSDEVAGTLDDFYSRLHAEDEPALQAALAGHLEAHEPFDMRFRLRHGAGHWRWFQARGQAEWNEAGEPLRMVGSLRDVTNLRASELELESSLTQARQLAEAAQGATRAKSAFLATMSHEIRTPLNGVLGMLSLLLDTPLSDEQREFAETARASGEGLLTIINDVLDFSKIEAGKLTIEPIPFDLRVTTEDVAAMLAPKAEEKGFEIVLAYDVGAPWRLVGDPGRIRQVLTNLVGNAIKFTPAGSVRVEVRALEVEEREARLRIDVIDTGIGITREQLPLLFQTFSQADASTTRLFGGTGLGLAISKQLVELMGGEIGVESEPGAGSRFWFALPLPRDLSPVAVRPQPVSVEGVAVLVVDDTDVARRILAEQLAQWGLRPAVAASGSDALTLLREAALAGAPIPLALVDHRMPGMDGEMLGRAVRGDPLLADTSLLLLTSGAQAGAARHFEQIGFAAYLVKPVQPSLLHDALATAWAYARSGTKAHPLITRHSLAEARRTAGERSPRGGDRSLAGPPSGRGVSRPTPSVALPAIAVPPSHDRVTRVLVAEDNVVNQRVAAAMLAQLRCAVDVASNGLEAVTMAAATPYDLVLMDCQMPVMDGYEATVRIREREAAAGTAHVPVIAITANAMQGDRERCIAAGMDDHLPKPIERARLRELLERWTGAVVGA